MKPNIIHLTETGSTNSYAIALLRETKPDEGSVIITDHQTLGKGTDTNTWESEKGKNLTFSLILYPTFNATQQFSINKAISVGICNFLRSELNQNDVMIKWPNDIYIADKKVCGILIQNSVMGNKLNYMVVGIGINVNQTNFKSNAPNPVSMKMTTGKTYDLNEILEKLLSFIYEKYDSLNSGSGQQIENEYHKALYRLNELHEFIVNGVKTCARITGTNTFGQLFLETESKQLLTCDMSEVKFVI